MTPPTPSPLPQPARYTCPNCGAGWNEPQAYCPNCGAAQPGVGQKSAIPVWLKTMLIIFGVLGLMCFCALGACFLFLANPRF